MLSKRLHYILLPIIPSYNRFILSKLNFEQKNCRFYFITKHKA